MAAPRHLPGIDTLLQAGPMAVAVERFGAASVKAALRDLQDHWRSRGEAPAWAAQPQAWADEVIRTLGTRRYRPVFNLTGTVIHTNLGRALPSPSMLDAVRDLVTRPMTLEYDLESGRRGHRDAPVQQRLTALTGAAAATVVNNNAAALMLVLNSLARDRVVPVSRGELIEIGGSFRLPDIMERSGCRLLEVGTTNRTHPADYLASADHQPALLLKVHPSNFHITGFTRTPTVRELADAAATLGVPLCVDLGSGTLVDLRRWGLPHEPTPADILAQGADLVTFSGDKLLGGVQAGLIVGRADLIEACQRNPLKRALRPDKITLALLDGVLAEYERPETLTERLPLLATLTTPASELRRRAEQLAPCLRERLPTFAVEVCDCESQIGSGALPDHTLPSIGLRLSHADDHLVEALHGDLRRLAVPVIARLSQGAVWLDMRGADPLEELATVLAGIGSGR